MIFYLQMKLRSHSNNTSVNNFWEQEVAKKNSIQLLFSPSKNKHLPKGRWKIRLYSCSVYFCKYNIHRKHADTVIGSILTTSALVSYPLLYQPIRMFKRKVVFTCVLTYDLVSPPAPKSLTMISLFLAQQPPVCHSLIHEVSTSHTTMHHSR